MMPISARESRDHSLHPSPPSLGITVPGAGALPRDASATIAAAPIPRRYSILVYSDIGETTMAHYTRAWPGFRPGPATTRSEFLREDIAITTRRSPFPRLQITGINPASRSRALIISVAFSYLLC